MVGSFEDLEVFQRAYRLSVMIHRESLRFPVSEQYALGDQIRRAFKSIPANIAEGFGCDIALTSDISNKRLGSIGGTNIEPSPKCRKDCMVVQGPRNPGA